jgi:hypothetical protein
VCVCVCVYVGGGAAGRGPILSVARYGAPARGCVGTAMCAPLLCKSAEARILISAVYREDNTYSEDIEDNIYTHEEEDACHLEDHTYCEDIEDNI